MINKIIVFLTIITLSFGLYSASNKKSEVLFNKCVGCTDCLKVCPKDAISIVKGKAVIDLELCIGCRKCFYICSFGAIRSGVR